MLFSRRKYKLAHAIAGLPQRSSGTIEIMSRYGLVAHDAAAGRRDALDIDSTLVAMRADKKVRSGRLRFVLPSAIGAAQVFMDVTESEIRAALTVLISPREACV